MDEASRAPKQNVVSTAARAPARNHFRNVSLPAEHRWKRQSERQPLLRQRSLGPDTEDDNDMKSERTVAGGTVLGIHNLAIVMPQFIVSRSRTNKNSIADLRPRLQSQRVLSSGLSTRQRIPTTTTLTSARAAWPGS